MTTTIGSGDIEATGPAPGDRNPALLYIAQLGPGSRRTMTEALQKIARLASDGRNDMHTLPWHKLRAEHTRELRDRLARDLAPATANKHLAALRGVLKQAWQLGLISAEVYHSAIELRAVHGPSPRKTRTLNAEELHALAAACERDRSPAGARDAALLALLFGVGLRRAEVAALDVSDYDRRTSTICVRGGESRPTRRFSIGSVERTALDAWLDHRGVAQGPFYNPVNKGGRIEIRRLSEQAIYVACHKRSAEAGLPPVSPEDLRRSQLLASGRRRSRLRSVSPASVVVAIHTA
ncbi:MAG: tyrosine-type recombinase/integrase [Deltaproteobacteria bacterium]|nr:tyrosine-type recombinase/integrase [Deltaproteobacteria bacterium]